MLLYIIRHATPADQTGADNVPLSPQGEVEARQLAGLFAGLSLPAGTVRVVASPAVRARKTAEAIAAMVAAAADVIPSFVQAPGPSPADRQQAIQDLVQLASPAAPPEHLIMVNHWATVNTRFGHLVGARD